MSKVIVTGGAGFIGSHIVDKLIRLGHQVLVVDNLSTGRLSNLNQGALFRRMDINDDRLSDVFTAFRPEVVIHHAAQVSVAHSMKNPLLDAKVNIMGTINVLEACQRSGAGKIIYASSAAVYGKPERAVIDEDHALNPMSFYGISKHTPEHYIETYAELIGLEYTIFRYSNVYGGRQDAHGEGGVVSIFTDRLLSNEKCLIFGDGEQTRDFIYVKDIVEANIAAMTRGSGLIMNISNNTSTTVNELLRTMCELLGKPFSPTYMPSRPGDIKDSMLDNSRARRELGWAPGCTLQVGLEETLHYEQLQKRLRKGAS
ncbi:UDP-glucose 4-epimerase [Paenibacillus phyllosphaerae]|uniref:UDP-glucose 4-epimerase n=1 Tax=Paenibacillus phyllosphaerae TaxID=274593 RepID=A0A7W5AV41_9BACL|nr:NAD-dependent epimerase/dehydratase family protein [Paenibacillus phyllosphaerae]MBB3108741.1 UDP-glucose 4-epimerase [Paenibacillus phyllosphaerae]